MNALLKRALVAYTGMPDEPPRFMRGEHEDATDVDYRSAMVSGECEFMDDVAPDADRVIAPPPPPVEINHHARATNMAWAAVIVGYLVLVALLKL